MTTKAWPWNPKRAETTLAGALMRARRHRGGKHVVIEDFDGRTLAYDDVVKGMAALGSVLARKTAKNEAVGIMMPTGAPGFISVLALSAYGRIPAMLNFSAGLRNLRAACAAAQVTRIVTARGFIEKANLQPLVDALSEIAEFIYLEDARAEIGAGDKLRAMLALAGILPSRARPGDTAVILFTSGTEGDPKGVALSHRNIVANVEQVRAHISEFTDGDCFFNPLPIFHSFGLVPGGFLPILTGMKTALHPTPLQPKEIAARVKETKATILLGSDTFVSQYARAGEEGSLSSLRFAVCGAERVKDETRKLLREKYGVVLLEGYGVTETSPVLCVNLPADNRSGTVGPLVPGIETKIEPVPGIDGAGKLLVRGVNIMRGYLTPAAPGVIQPPADGWHDTGDVVSMDDDGYVRIRGRLKRFAKIGGEMVSLAICENCATTLWPQHMHAAAAIPDGRKGEQIVLLTTAPEGDRAELLAFVQSHGAPELAAPKRVVQVEKIPLLPTGKTDFVAVNKLALEKAGEPAA